MSWTHLNKSLAKLTLTVAEWHDKSDHERFRKGKDEGGLQIPYIIHPLQVLYRLQRWGITQPTIWNADLWAAALCHDIKESTPIDDVTLVGIVGTKVAGFVDQLTYIDGPKSDYMDSFREKPIDVVVIKLADRLENTADFRWQRPEYADKYLRKAESLFQLLDSRRQEIVERFGESVWQAIKDDCTLLQR